MATPIQTLSAPAPNGGAATPLSEATGGLGKDDFLKLLVGQLRNQNPLEPVKDQEFMGQMAAFSTLEQVTNLSASNERLNQTTSASQSIALIGHQVTYLKPDGTGAEGLVEHVSFGDEGFTLTIAGESGVAPGQVTEVR
jgi:flagellar basal-body rod modification protein FlgD